MDTKKLRQKILDLAIHGKLVPQDPNDEPASVLLERIRAEKERLIKEGKIKQSKKSAKSSDTRHYENVPFKVPEGWEWTVIEDVTVNRDAERIPLSLAVRKKQQNKVYDYYGAAGVIDKVENYLFDERLLLIGEDGANLLSRSKNNAFFAEGKYWVNNHAHVLDCPSKSVLDYVAFVINSMSLDDYITGSAQPKLTQDNLNKILIPLPPEKEQHRIIESVNDYFSYISLLENEIEEMNSFVQKAKSKILDLAVHGKLVPQDPNDEPAIELLKRINPKFTPCDNGHDEKKEIPDSWIWCTLHDSFNITMGSSPTGDALNREKQGVEFHQGKVFFSNKNILPSDIYTTQPVKMAEPHSILLCVRAPVGTVNITDRQICIGRGLCSLMPSKSIDLQYAYYVLQTCSKELEQKATGSTFKAVSGDIVKKQLIPFPPYNEQLRIVKRIEELFAVLDEIQKSIEA